MRAPGPRDSSSFAVVLPVVLTLVVTVALAWSAWSARREHRRVAEETARAYATFAATLAAASADAAMEQVLLYAFYGADLADRRGSAEPVLPGTLATNPAEAGRCESHYPRGRWFARVAPDGETDIHGPLDPGLGRWLADTLVALQGRPDAARHGNLFPPEGGPPAIAYRLRRDEEGNPVEAHALAHCFESREGPVFEAARHRTPLLPPTAAAGSDSLVTLTVTDPRGRVVYRPPSRTGPAFEGARPADPSGPLAGLSFSAAVPTAVAEELVAGGIPAPGSGATWLLVILAGCLGVATILQVRRSLALARARERFVASVSHELRTPLQLVLLFAQLLRTGRAGTSDEREESAGIIEREARRLIALVERVLAFAGPGPAAVGDGAPESVDLGPVTRETVDAFRPLAEAEAVEVRVEVPPGLPPIRARGEAVRHVLLNLLDNAVRHGPRGQRVVVRATPGNGRVDLIVDDEGPGIPADERERVWEPFGRLHRDGAGDETGSGIGLTVVRDTVEAMGGRVWIEDAPDRGTRVVVRLPADGSEEGAGR